MQIYKENIMKKKEIKKLTKVQMKENIEKHLKEEYMAMLPEQ